MFAWARLIDKWNIVGSFLGGLVVKNSSANAGDARDTGLIPELRRSPWRRAWQLTLVFLPGKFRGKRSLAKSDATQHTHTCAII